MGADSGRKLLKNGVPIVTVFELPVLAEAQTADRFLTNLPEMCGPTGKIAPLPLPMSMADFIGRSRGRDTEFLVVRHSLAHSCIPVIVYKYMKTNNKPIDKHTRSAVHFPRGAL